MQKMSDYTFCTAAIVYDWIGLCSVFTSPPT